MIDITVGLSVSKRAISGRMVATTGCTEPLRMTTCHVNPCSGPLGLAWDGSIVHDAGGGSKTKRDVPAATTAEHEGFRLRLLFPFVLTGARFLA